MFAKDFLNDPRFVDLTPLIEAWNDAKSCLDEARNFLRPSLVHYVFGDDALVDYELDIVHRKMPSVYLYIWDETTRTCLVHLGAVKMVCEILHIPYPEKSMNIRMMCIGRPDVYNHKLSPRQCTVKLPRVHRDLIHIDKLMERMSLAVEIEEEPILLRRLCTILRVLRVEQAMTEFKYMALASKLEG